MKRIATILTFILFCLGNITLASKLPIAVSNRVDTNDAEVRSVIKLYADYLNSAPEKIYDNPYWNKIEKEKYDDFDFSRTALFQGLTANKLQSYYPPFILSVSQVNEKYKIRVLYSNNAVDERYIGSKVWAIHQLFAIKESGQWVLENSLPNITAKWKTVKTERIHFIYPQQHLYSPILADRANYFCNDIITRFNPKMSEEPFRFYITNSADEMGRLENFDYYFSGFTTGKSKEGMVFTAKGNEFYPHEFVHQLLPKNQRRSSIIEEGLATYLGTRENKKAYEFLMSRLAEDLLQSAEINFDAIFDLKVRYNGYQIAYPAGAAICEIVYKHKKDEGLKELINGNSSNKESLLQLLTTLLSMNKDEIIQLWKTTILIYHK